MKYITRALGTEWYLTSSNELALMLLLGFLAIIGFAFIIVGILRMKANREDYMKTLDDKEYRKYRKFLDKN